ncbi:MAG: gfo/Idh/MocA family oxidoreductase [Spirochaetaceae bacterium]|nr:MAG: gfo/Idh/MocA family oxidoreductase [Spirochaetaceae bacterium]
MDVDWRAVSRRREVETTVRWGIIGTANIATKVARAISLAPGNEIVAIASRDKTRAAEWAKEHGAEKAYGSYEDCLADPEIDAVYIPLPPTLHADWTIRAADAGKHVLSEKPLTVDPREAVEMVSACRTNNVQLMDGVMWVHHDRTKEIRALLDRSELGELRSVTSAFAFNWGATVPTANIRARKELGGGALGDLGYYCVRGILWAFGEIPERVFAASRYANGVDIETSGMLFFSRERVAQFDCGFTTKGRMRLELAASDGTLTIDDFVVPGSEEQASYSIRGRAQQPEVFTVGPCIQEVNMIARFSEIVQSGSPVGVWPEEAVATVRTCAALARSAETGAAVEVAPE